jgi:hypothetical protein
MSNQYAHPAFYQQHQQPRVHDYPSGVDPPYSDYPQQCRPSQLQPSQPTYQLAPAGQPLPTPVSPIPVHYLAHSHSVDHFSSQVAPSHSPISAPSPQYPQQLPDIPHVGYTSPPTSPVFNGLSRRPLPTPGAPPSQFTSPPFRPPLPTPGPTPVPIPPQSRSHSSQTPTLLPNAAVTAPTQPLPSSLPSASPTSPTSSRRPLPLPRSVPGSSSDSAPRSSSPVRDASKQSSASSGVSVSFPADSSTQPTKFVPYWKRTLPEPSSDRAASASSSQEAVNSTHSGPSSVSLAEDNQHRDRTKSITSGRPLPPSPLDGSIGKPPIIPPSVGVFGERSRTLPNPSSPVKPSTRPPSPVKPTLSGQSRPSTAGSSAPFSTRTVSPTKGTLPISPASSDDDGKPSQNGKVHQQDRGTPSPQYGIRELPHKSRSVINHNHAKHARLPASSDRDEEPHRGRVGRSSTLPQAPPQSFPLQFSHRSTQSVTMRSNPAIPLGAGTSGLTVSQPSSPTGWSTSHPSRSPISSTGNRSTVSHTRNPRQEYVNLDDAPPPSLRRSPSPSGISTRTLPPMKTQSTSSSAHRGRTRDPPAPSRRSAVSVPSSPEKTSVNLPQVPSATNHQRSRSRSVTPANRQPPVERPRAQQQPASRPPPSAFSQRFVSGKPPPVEPQITTTRVSVPLISTPNDGNTDDDGGNASIFVSEPELPQITFSDPTASLDMDDEPFPSEGVRHDHAHSNNTPMPATGGGRVFPPASSARRGGGLACGGCSGPIVGRIVSAMGVRWHPGCFRCSDCNDLLEYVSSYERDGKPYCHFDYHERFAPRCYHCKTAIVDERFITLDDPELGKRTYHEQHFFCSECGDPFLAPSIDRQTEQGAGGVTFKGDGEFENDDVGFTVYKGYPYCEACHVRLRSPKCKRCKKSIRDGMQAVEALGGKFHWQCFCCTGCDKPFEDPSFFLRENKPFCERCYSIILKSEL